MDGFAIVEQMGHRRVTGRVAEVEVCGTKMLRVETLSTPPIVTLVHPQSLFAITPCSEERARRAAADYHPLRELEAPVEACDYGDGYSDDPAHDEAPADAGEECDEA